MAAERPRCGLDLDRIYHVLDVVIVEASASLIANAITAGLVCLRAIQTPVNEAAASVYQGRWDACSELWQLYPIIDALIRGRTTALMVREGLVAPEGTAGDTAGVAGGGSSRGLFWMQIEDFVDSFNRMYILHDQMWREDCKHVLRRYKLSSGRSHGTSSAGDGSWLSLDEGAEAATSRVRRLVERSVLADKALHPFRVLETTDASFHLYQSDRRLRRELRRGTTSPAEDNYFWSRLQQQKGGATRYTTRTQLLRYPAEYSAALGLMIFRLNEEASEEVRSVAAMRYSLRDIIKTSRVVSFSQGSSVTVHLEHGVYAVLPLIRMEEEVATDAFELVMCVDAVYTEFSVEVGQVECSDLDRCCEAHALPRLHRVGSWEWLEATDMGS